jgi:hypothetical protein
MCNATTDKDWSSTRTVTGTTSSFLTVDFCGTTTHFATCFCFMVTLTRICHLTDICLVHQTRVHFFFENVGLNIKFLDFFALHIYN